MKFKNNLSILASAVVALAMLLPIPAKAQDKAATDPAPKPTIVLVHGAFADAAGWGHVITRLEKAGYYVSAVENALNSFADDVATTRRMVDAQKGSVVLVGHSYGGAVITAASVGAANIKSLVYVDAFGPDSGEVVGALTQKYPSMLDTSLVPDAAGYLYIDRAKFKAAFAADVPDEERNIMAATQKPINSAIFGTVFGTPGWKSHPCWFIVGTQDNTINPDMQRMFAKRMNAKTTELSSSHVPFISQPDAVVKVILEAATAK